MKINDKHLCALAIGSASVDKQGFLLKRGEQNKSYQKRWFLLKGNLLFYFEKPGDREPLGVIILQCCVVQLSENEDAYAFELDFEGTSARTYVLAAETQDEMEDWMRAVTAASYDFMKLKLSELQQRLDDLNEEQRRSSGTSEVPLTLPLPVNLPFCGMVQPDLLELQTKSSSVGPCGRSTTNHSNSGGVRRARSFEEMHNDFGRYIQERVKGAFYTATV